MFTIDPNWGFLCDDFTLSIELAAGTIGLPQFGDARAIWIDGVWVEDVCIPEPLTVSLLAGGLLALRRRRRK